MTSKSKLIWFKIYPAEMMQHFTHRLDYDIVVMGIKSVLWSCSVFEEPVGTLPDDNKKWSRWTGQDVRIIEAKKDLITSSWTLNSAGRWEIKRIMDAAAETSAKSKSAAIGARKRWDSSKPNDANEHANAYANASADALQTECHLKVKVKDRVKVRVKDKDRIKEKENTLVKSEADSDGQSVVSDEIKANAKIIKADTERVWRHYLKATGLSEGTYRLTDSRKKKIRTRLGEFETDALCVAIDACMKSDFHAGRYDDLVKHILWSYEKVEWWLNKRAEQEQAEAGIV